ncbi:hypothetical protein LCGC14_0939490 [marine sediment metagenome]|uniref:Uncharacterized protein n=1 Tax=marine sediment metagenome TaxID=412755 RepID=A0A0F9NKH8_9ZZZZ
MAVLRKYGIATTISFPLIDRDATDFESTPVTHASADTKISKNAGSFANTTNAFAHVGNGIYSLVLTDVEMQASRIVLTVIDQSTKAWEDQCILIETYGHASAQHGFDLDDDTGIGEILSMQDVLDVLLRTVLDSTLMIATTVASLASQTVFTLSAGSTDDDAYNDCMIVLKSVSTPARKAVGFISDYVGFTKGVTLIADPGIFDLAVDDELYVMTVPMKKVDDIKKLLRADRIINTSATPWVVDHKEEGTETALMSKTMKNTDGENISSENNTLGQLEQE